MVSPLVVAAAAAVSVLSVLDYGAACAWQLKNALYMELIAACSLADTQN